MEPVVGGLEDKFPSQVEIRRVDVNSPDGRSAFQTYRLRGHPSFVLLGTDGNILWSGLGVQAQGVIEKTIQEYLTNY